MYVYKVRFRSERFASLEEAGPIFRTAVGIVDPLAHSLLGRKPLCEQELNLDLDEHQTVRKFKDEEGLLAFASYLSGAISRTADGKPNPLIRVRISGSGAVERFYYETANKRARILLYKSEDGWRVAGSGDFRYPDSVLRALRANGFNCVARGATQKPTAMAARKYNLPSAY